MNASAENPSRQEADRFRSIAHRYDLANRIISLGRDTVWRRSLATHMHPGNTEGALLDVACGTGEQLLAIIQRGCVYRSMTGLDCSQPMLEQARKKQILMRYAIQWVKGSAVSLPFPDASFSAITLSFGLRNIPDRAAALRELRRVMEPSGRIAVLEFSMPNRGILRALFGIYLTTFLPWAGGVITGDYRAYRYLARSIRVFPAPNRIRDEMLEAGFSDPRVIPVEFGCVFLYLAQKKPSEEGLKDGSGEGI